MEAIKEYLNNLFMNLPETPVVLRAKAELLEMMEDKYDELIKEGKSETEAIGIVISEFGNLEELSGELGIDDYMNKESEVEQKKEIDQPQNTSGSGSEKKRAVYCWGFDEAQDYISYAWRHGIYIAAGVLLCICAPFMSSVFDGIAGAGYMPDMVADGIGTTALFLFVAAAVGLFCMASGIKKQYGKLSRICVLLDEKAKNYVEQKQQNDSQRRLTMRTVGIVCCIMSVVPSSLNYASNVLVSEILDASVLVIAGVGVFLLVLSASVGNRYDDLEKAAKNAGNMEGATFEGAVWKPVAKKKMSKGVVLVLILAAVLVVGGNTAAAILYMMPGNAGSSEMDVVAECDFHSIKEIEIDLNYADLKIEQMENEDDSGLVKVEYGGKHKYCPEVKMKDGKLCIQKNGSGIRWLSLTGFGKGGAEVKVYLPKQAAMGEYDMNVNTDAGSIKCTGVAAKNLNVELNAGEAVLDACRITGVADMEVDAGNIQIRNSAIATLKGEVNAGDIKYETSETPFEAYKMNLDIDLGEIIVNGKNQGTKYSQDGSVQNGNSFSQEMELAVDLGNIEIKAPVQ